MSTPTTGRRLIRVAGIAVSGLLLGLALASPATATPDTDCADYPSRAIAQAEFVLHGGSKDFNWNGLDNDGDGQVCEHHQFPGEPTPPPNPGPGGCAVCPSPSASASPVPHRSHPVGRPGPGEHPPAPAQPQLPVTGPSGAVLAGWGAGILLIGVGAIAWSRSRRRVVRDSRPGEDLTRRVTHRR